MMTWQILSADAELSTEIEFRFEFCFDTLRKILTSGFWVKILGRSLLGFSSGAEVSFDLRWFKVCGVSLSLLNEDFFSCFVIEPNWLVMQV